MRVIILLLLFLYTLIPSTLFILLKKSQAYFYLKDAKFENGSLTLKELGFGANGIFGRNFSFYAEELIIGKESTLKNVFINLINLKESKEPFVLEELPIREIPINIKVENLNLTFYSPKEFNYVNVKKASIINNRITGEFSYTNFGAVSLNGQLKAKISGEELLLEDLIVDSERFFTTVRGKLGRKRGVLSFQGKVNPIEKKNFFMEAITFEGTAKLKLPSITYEAKVSEPRIRVVEEEFLGLAGKIWGEGKLFKTLVVNGEFTNGQVKLKAKYNLIPEDYLTFFYENLSLSEKAFKTKEKVKLLLSGKGKIRFLERKLSVQGSGKGLLLGRESFKEGSFELDYGFEGKGRLKARLINAGSIALDLQFGEEGLSGEAKAENYRLNISELQGTLRGVASFKKVGESLEVKFLGDLINPEYKEIKLPPLHFTGTLKNSNLSMSIGGRGIEANLFGELKALQAVVYFKDFELKPSDGTVKVSSGTLFLETKDGSVKGRGNFSGLNLLLGDLRLESSGSLALSKVESLNLQVDGNLSAYYGKEVIDDSLRYALGVNGNLIDFIGVSKRTNLRLKYDTAIQEGSFTGKYNTERAFLNFWGKMKGGQATGEGEVRLNLLNDYLRLLGSFEVKGDYASLNLKPYTYKGKLLSYEFKGLKITKVEKNISLSFGGLEALFLRRPILIASSAKGEGTTQRLKVSPIQLSGLVNGTLNLSYEGGLEIDSKGKIDLTLLSKNIASLMKSELEGSADYEFRMKGKDFKLVATTKDVVKIRSAYFYEPFIGAINLEAEPNSLMFGMVSWFKDGYLNAYAISKDYKNFDVVFQFEKVPLRYNTDELRLVLLADGRGNLSIKNFKSVNLVLQSAFDGSAEVLKASKKAKEEKPKPPPLELTLNASFNTKTGLNVKLPEGRVFTALKGKVYGKYPDINYDLSAELLSGKLNYFEKDFIVKGGRLALIKKKEGEERYIDLELNTWEKPYKIFLKVKGDLNNPEVYYFSEPPLSKDKILLLLVGGGTGNAVLPVATVLSQEIKQVGTFKGKLEKLLDVKVGVGVQTSPTGELGATVDVRKDVGRFFNAKYRYSTLKDKKATYFGAEAKPPVDADIGFQFFMYSDKAREYRIGYRKEFNF